MRLGTRRTLRPERLSHAAETGPNQPQECRQPTSNPDGLALSSCAVAVANNSETPFPTIVAWFCLILSGLLFFRDTVPALRERHHLQATQQDLHRLRADFETALARERAATPEGATEFDLQSVLVAIDRIGWTPAELLSSYAAPANPPVEGEDEGR